MTTLLFFGFLVGMRHALEADHLAAVANLSAGRRSFGSTVLRGAVWGLGHSLTLLLLAGSCLLLGRAVPDSLARLFEAAVGVMLVALGGEVLWRLYRQRVHVHVHRHADGTVHLHAHSHAGDGEHDPEAHDHPHAEPFPRRALAVGMVHGLAGSAALVLLTLDHASSPWLGVAYVALFGLGSIVGMAVLSAAVALPLRKSTGLVGRLMNGMEGTVGAATVALGLWVILRQVG